MDAVTKGVGAAVPIIERRLELLPQFFREDNFRYLVFDEFRKAGVDVARIKPEYPHPVKDSYGRAKIDAVILDEEKVAPETAIEFKCIRESGAITTDAGELLADFARLRDFPNVHRFVALLTDGKLWRYLSNPNNGLNWLFSQSEQEISDGNIPNTPSLRDSAGDWSSPVRAQVTGMWDVGNDHKLIVWRAWRVET